MKKSYFLTGGLLALTGAVLFFKNRPAIPKGLQAIPHFDKKKYLGKWYEIARLNYRFERGLYRTTAAYSLNEDGSIRVENRGYERSSGKVKVAVGKARFRGSDTEAALEVSFFGPFYAGYNVIAIDPEYKYALVAGRSLDYLWLLSREPSMPEDVKRHYLAIAHNAGFPVKELVWVEQQYPN